MEIKYNIIVVGCGGTGGNFISLLGRYLYDNSLAKMCRITLVDGDIVEKKNIGRQPFLQRDIRKKKAEVMSEIMMDVFEVNCCYYPEYINCVKDIQALEADGYVTVLVGCVDNHACRLVFHEYFKKSTVCYYLDSANEYSVGELVVGMKAGGSVISPDRAHYFPEILEDTSLPRREESCEALNNSSPQHLATNMLAAVLLFKCTIEIIQEELWTGGIYYFDTFRGSVSFKEGIQV